MKHHGNNELAVKNFITIATAKGKRRIENDTEEAIPRTVHDVRTLRTLATQAATSLPPNRAFRYDPFDVSQCLSTEEGGTREGTAGVWSAAVDAVLHGRRIHIPR